QLVEYLSRPDLPPKNRRKALNYLSQCAIQLQQLDQAAEISRRLLKQYPEEPDVKLTLGRSLLLQIMRSGRSGNEEIVKEAIENLRPLAENGNEEAIEQLAQIYMYSGELDDAAELLVNHCDQHPRDARALSLLYTVLVRQNEYDEAEERLQRAVEESPDNKASEHLLAGIDGDGEWKDYILDLLPLALEDEEVERQIGLLRFYRMRGRDEMADEMFDKLVDNHPKDPRVLEEQFSRLLDEEKWQTAEEVHQKFKDTVDNELEPILWEARLYIARENYNEAIELLENELADDTPLSEAWAVLGNAYRGLGDYSKAQATLEKALERNPANHRALRHIIAVCDARGFRRQALSYMRRGLHFAPNDQQLVRLFLNYLEDYESPSQALNLRLQIASRQPGNRENRRAIARLYMKTDDLESAKNVIDGLYNENPDDLQTVVLLARYHALTGDVSKGKSTIKTYLEAQDERSTGDLLQYASFLIQYGEEQEKVEKIVNEAIEIESEENREATQFYATWLMDRDEHEKAKDIYQTLHKDIGDDKFLLSAAEADLELGEAEQAKETVNNYLQDNQMSVQAANLKTRIHISLQEYTQARRTIDRAIEQAPDNVRSRMLRAELGIRSSSHVSGDRIRNDLEKALEIDPDNDSARRTLVSWLMNEGKEDQAISHMEELIKENPESSEARDLLANLYFQQQEYSKLESMLNEWKEVTDDESLRILHWEGRLAEAQEDWEKAIDYFQTLIAEDSSENNLARYLNILIKADRPDEAISEFENYEDETQQDLDVLLQYGRALAVKGDTREAREPLAEAVKLADDDERRKYEMLRNVRSILDRESWNKFLHDDISVSDDAVISYFLAEEDLRNGGSEKAMSRLEKIKEDLDTDNFLYPRVLISLSDTYIQMDKNEKAADFLEEALEIAPDNPRVLNNLAYQMALLNRDPYKAIELADRALENISEEGEMRANILDTRGFAQFKAGLYAHAQTSYTNSLRNHPTAVAYTHLGELYLEQDKPVAAKRMLDLAMEIGKEQDEMSDKVRKDIDDLMKQADERVKAMDEEERKAELDEESDEIEEIEGAGDE
ncbi:MAG: tetratricopeptide repeat protein, partial [Verrucomicrobiota bacterium]